MWDSLIIFDDLEIPLWDSVNFEGIDHCNFRSVHRGICLTLQISLWDCLI